MKTTTNDMTLADAIRAGLGIGDEDNREADAKRQRVAALLLNPLLFYMGARNGGKARLECRNDTRLWDMYYMQVQISVKRCTLTPYDRSIEIIPEFALCAFDDGGVGRKLSPLEALDHIDPQALRDRIAAAFARLGDADRIKV